MSISFDQQQIAADQKPKLKGWRSVARNASAP